VSRKRLADARWGKIHRISPHEKKEKNFAEAKIRMAKTPMSAAIRIMPFARLRWRLCDVAVQLPE
jgi:hypothetical protein